MFVSIDDALFNTVTFGAGTQVLVALGGWTGSWEMWQQPFEHLSGQLRCVSYDHRGSGATISDPESITATRLVADLFAIMDSLDIENCTLAAESMGGLIALLAVEQRPERFDGLILVSSVFEVTPETTSWLVSGSRDDYPRIVADFVEMCVPEDDSEHLKQWGRQLLGRAQPEAAARLFEGCYGAKVDLSRIELPTLVIHGTEDAIVSADVAHHLATNIADTELVAIAGAGHVPTVTRPAEVAAIVSDWLARRVL